MLLLGAIGWGLLAVAAITHLWHRDRLVDLLALHVDRPRPLAATLIAVEAGLAVALASARLADAPWLPVVTLAAVVLGIGFVVWIARLLRQGSALPCACSYSAAPTSGWSLARAVAVLAVAAWAFPIDPVGLDALGALVAGMAVAGAIFVVPEALSWPEASRAQLARLDSHAPGR